MERGPDPGTCPEQQFGGALIAIERFTKEPPNTWLAADKCNAVSFGIRFITNRLEQDSPLNEPDFATFYGEKPKWYGLPDAVRRECDKKPGLEGFRSGFFVDGQRRERIVASCHLRLAMVNSNVRFYRCRMIFLSHNYKVTDEFLMGSLLQLIVPLPLATH